MPDETTTIFLQVDAGPEGDEARVEQRKNQLRQQLKALDEIEAVGDLPAATAPEGSKAGFVGEAGALLVQVIPMADKLSIVVGWLHSWVATHHQGSVSLTIDGDKLEIKNATDEEVSRLADAWIKRHQKR
jgi:hypothetical protein